MAVKEGGPDPAVNGKLRDLISKAKANNVPNDNIDRIIKKASSEGDKMTMKLFSMRGTAPAALQLLLRL